MLRSDPVTGTSDARWDNLRHDLGECKFKTSLCSL